MLKPLRICLVLLLLVSCATMDEYDRELEKQRAEQLKGVMYPPATVIDCYNILGARHVVTGKIVMKDDKPFLTFTSSSCADGKLRFYKPDKNMVTCKYTFPGADPQPFFTVSVVMAVSADKKIYAICHEYNYSGFDPLQIRYFIYKSKVFEDIEYSTLPADLKDRFDRISWPKRESYW